MADLVCGIDEMSSFAEECVDSGGDDNGLDLALFAG